jgi:transcription elongation factor Elf1
MWPEDKEKRDSAKQVLFAEQYGGAVLLPEMVAKALKDLSRNDFKFFQGAFVGMGQGEGGRSFHEMGGSEAMDLPAELLAPEGVDKIAYYNRMLDWYAELITAMNGRITAMVMEEYSTRRVDLLGEASLLHNRQTWLQKLLAEAILEKRENDKMLLACAWCGKECETVERRDEHEDVCGL